MLYRVFPYREGAAPDEEGGPLYVPRERQGAGRHDNPEWYGALYLSRHPESAVAERLQAFRGKAVTDVDLRRVDGRRHAIATFDDGRLGPLTDLDDPAELVARGLRPSIVATGERAVTQRIARQLFDEGGQGFGWWSTLEATWANVTIFSERAVPSLMLTEAPVALSIEHPVVRAAADRLGVALT